MFGNNMKTKLFEFESTSFEIMPDEDEETNPGIYGKSLSIWLAERLTAHGFNAEKVIPEDFGWCIPIESKQHSLYVTCASADSVPTHWVVFGFAEGWFLLRFVGKDTRKQSITRLNSVLGIIFRESTQVQNLCETET
jgi:hypothetical protein